MSEIKAAAEEVRGLEKHYRAVLALGSVLGKIADVEALGEEVSRDTERLKAENAEALMKINRIGSAIHAAEKDLADAQAEASKTASEAEAKAADTRRKGEDYVARMIADARAEVQQAQTAIQQAQDLHKQWMGAAEIEKTKLLNSIEALKAEFAALKTRLG